MQHRFESAAQPWLMSIPVMQQSVLFSAIRGPDGFAKHHNVKPLLRWYRRCVLISAFDGITLTEPYSPGGGSFTGPSLHMSVTQANGPEWWTVLGTHSERDNVYEGYAAAETRMVDLFIHARDEMTLHYYAHAMHAFQIIGAHHPVERIREFWRKVYERMVNALHLEPEPDAELNRRLGDNEAGWSLKADESGSCSE